jgi:hypothetical protein
MALREVKGWFLGELSAMRKLKKRPCETTGFANQISAPEYINCYCLVILSGAELLSSAGRHAFAPKSTASTLAAASSAREHRYPT